VKFIPHPEDLPQEAQSIQFHFEDIIIPGFIEEAEKSWIIKCVKSEDVQHGTLQFIFCRDEYLYEMNVKYLGHHDYTDVITFDYSANKKVISGDIFISYERVVDNAHAMGEDVMVELRRVLIHGVLHLIGYTDQSPEDQAEMRRKENYCLSLRQQI